MSPAPRVHLIAEAGNNHNGELETAKQLIETAVAAGADSVKFQMINPDGLYLPEVWEDGVPVPNEVFEQRKQLVLSDAEYHELNALANSMGIGFSASVFDGRGVKLLSEFNPPYIKIASCDLNNHPLLEQAASTGIPVVLSTGMSTIEDVERSVQVLQNKNSEVILLHCVSVYPASVETMNLGFIEELKRRFACEVGLSDHTQSGIAAAVAIGLGATWIEKHFTLDKTQAGFDHAYAMEPDEFKGYVADLRLAESSLGTAGDKIGQEEMTTRKRARRGLYAARDIPAGRKIDAEDILIVRPEGPMEPSEIETVVGATATTLIRAYQPFRQEHLR